MENIAKSIEELVRKALGLDDPLKSLTEILIPQLIATIFLILIVRFFFWNHITALLEKRKNYVENEIKEAELVKENAINFEKEKMLELENASIQAENIISKAKDKANKESSKIIEKANQDASNRLVKAEDEIKISYNNLKDQIKEEIVTISLLTAEKIIKKEIKKDVHKDLIKETLKEVGE